MVAMSWVSGPDVLGKWDVLGWQAVTEAGIAVLVHGPP